MLNGSVVYDFVLTPSPNTWRQHAGMLEQLGDGMPDRSVILKRPLRSSPTPAEGPTQPPDPDGPTVESVVKALAAPRWGLTARRTAKGNAWSEVRGGEVGRAEFIASVDAELMTACGNAGDRRRTLRAAAAASTCSHDPRPSCKSSGPR